MVGDLSPSILLQKKILQKVFLLLLVLGAAARRVRSRMPICWRENTFSYRPLNHVRPTDRLHKAILRHRYE